MSNSKTKYEELVDEGKINPNEPLKQEPSYTEELLLKAEKIADTRINKELNIVAWTGFRDRYISKHTKK